MRTRNEWTEYFPHLLFLVFLITAQAALAQPVKLSVTVDKRTVQVGETVGIVVALLDANNRNMRARKPYAISVQISLPSRKVVPLRGSIAVGQDTTQLSYKTQEPGITRIQASHGELRAGGTSLNVRPRGAATARSLTRPQASVATAPPPRLSARSVEAIPVPRPAPPPRGAVRSNETQSAREMTRTPSPAPAEATAEAPAEAAPVPDPVAVEHSPESPSAEVAPPPPPPPAAFDEKHLQLDYNPQQGLKADGQDAAEITAFLLGAEEPPTQDVVVRLHASAGNLNPPSMKIKAGEWQAVALLTSDRTGLVEVNYLDSIPRLPLAGDKTLQIEFAPPIWSLRVAGSPREITFLEQSKLLVELLDQNGNPVETDIAREVQVTITGGHGSLEKESVTISPGSAAASSGFTPSSWGAATFSASSAGLRTAETDIDVTFPFLLLSFSAIGGSVGGLLAFWIRKPSHWWRIASGVVAGFVLFWLFDLGMLTILPSAAVSNPLSAFALSAIGGWMGTEVFDVATRRLGLRSKPA